MWYDPAKRYENAAKYAAKNWLAEDNFVDQQLYAKAKFFLFQKPNDYF